MKKVALLIAVILVAGSWTGSAAAQKGIRINAPRPAFKPAHQPNVNGGPRFVPVVVPVGRHNPNQPNSNQNNNYNNDNSGWTVFWFIVLGVVGLSLVVGAIFLIVYLASSSSGQERKRKRRRRRLEEEPGPDDY